MTQRLTRDELTAWGRRDCTLPRLSGDLGPRTVLVRRIGAATYLSFLPPDPPGAELWPEITDTMSDEEKKATQAFRAAREQEYLESLAPKEQAARLTAFRSVHLQVIAWCAIEPTFTVDEAKDLGDDAVGLSHQILEFSGLLTPAPAPQGSA